nr:ATP-dependent Clp protease adapter ClpS [Novosphingobium aerophilum]
MATVRYDILPAMVSAPFPIADDILPLRPDHGLARATGAGWSLPPVGGPDDDGDGDHDGGGGSGTEIGIATRTRAKPKKPSQFRVLMLNDDYTPMEFVVIVLKRFFHMDLEQATRVMLHVHQKGVGVCGVFPYEIAETKVNQVMDFARQNQHPLQCTLEKA